MIIKTNNTNKFPFGIDLVRKAVNVMAYCDESWNQRWTACQLLELTKAHILADYDFLPDSWTEDQISDVLIRGLVPAWVEVEKPTIDYMARLDVQLIQRDQLGGWKRFGGMMSTEPRMRLDGSLVER